MGGSSPARFPHRTRTQPNPTQPNPTHGWTQPMAISGLFTFKFSWWTKKMRVFWNRVRNSRSRSSKVIDFGRINSAHATSYWSSIATLVLSCPVTEILQVLCWEQLPHFRNTTIQKGSPRARASNKGGVGKIRNFQPITRRISETVQDRTKVTIPPEFSRCPLGLDCRCCGSEERRPNSNHLCNNYFRTNPTFTPTLSIHDTDGQTDGQTDDLR